VETERELDRVSISSVRLRNFKALRDFSVPIRHVNFLVGPNNSGKSTVLGSFRVLAAALRRARTKRPERVRVNGESMPGYPIPATVIPISTENIQTDLEDVEATATFELSNRNKLHLHFAGPDQCVLVPQLTSGGFINGPAAFGRFFPVSVGVVPVLAPVEPDELLVAENTIRDGLAEYTRRASRHFRSYWHYHDDDFDELRDRISQTWPSITLGRPETGRGSDGKMRVAMFCQENRMPRELYWAGFGFQVWCQLLTHVLRESDATVLIVDEPEMYLHPDVQRQLVSILREAGPDILAATWHARKTAEGRRPAYAVASALLKPPSRGASRVPVGCWRCRQPLTRQDARSTGTTPPQP
jgi:energy-coupling factor transporter ATP-binding protein EcfA2